MKGKIDFHPHFDQHQPTIRPSLGGRKGNSVSQTTDLGSSKTPPEDHSHAQCGQAGRHDGDSNPLPASESLPGRTLALKGEKQSLVSHMEVSHFI